MDIDQFTMEVPEKEIEGSSPHSSVGVIENSTTNDNRSNGIGITSLKGGKEDKPPRFRRLSLVDRCIDEPEKLSVVVVGAGIAGIIAGVLLPPKLPGIELTIFEKNEDVVRPLGHALLVFSIWMNQSC